MTTFAAVVDALSGSAVDALIDFDEQLAVRAGLDPAQINAWAGVREVYFLSLIHISEPTRPY